MMRMFRKDEGFTLVELMVVVLIIGILVAIAIPVFNAASRSARQRTCHSNQRTIEGAVQQWLAASPTNNWDPDTTDAVIAGRVIDGTDPLTDQGAYLKDRPECPIAPDDNDDGVADVFYSTNASGTVITDGDPDGTWDAAPAWIADDDGSTHGHF